jgi:hypothetical protein
LKVTGAPYSLSEQAAFQLGIFSWHLCGQALKITYTGSAASPDPGEDHTFYGH